jgi:flagellar protein FlgJ
MIIKRIYAKRNLKNVVAFLDRMDDYALATEKQTGFKAEALIAQAALETGWGRYILSKNGESSNNLFNIKKGSSWNGPVMTKRVHEFINGKKVWVYDPFRKYTNFGNCFYDYCQLISSLPRYRNAYDNRGDVRQYVEAMARAGYATDPRYAQKILKIIDKYIGIELVDIEEPNDVIGIQ